MSNFAAPVGLADAKASIGSCCGQGNSCKSKDGSTATAPSDKAAWRNILSAVGGADRTAAGAYMGVGTPDCAIVRTCWACCNHKRKLQKRSTPLTPTGTATVTGKGTLYFYSDSLQGWCTKTDYLKGCK